MERQAVAADVAIVNSLVIDAGGVERQCVNAVILCWTVVYCVVYLWEFFIAFCLAAVAVVLYRAVIGPRKGKALAVFRDCHRNVQL